MNKLRFLTLNMVAFTAAVAAVVMPDTLFGQTTAPAGAATITVQADKPGAPISPLMYGIFFEDINFAADGGLYPERVKNGSFEFEDPMMGWRRPAVVQGGAVGGFGVVDDRPLNANNTRFLRAYLEQAGQGLTLTNEGFRGIGVQQGAKYTFSFYARTTGATAQPMSVSVELTGTARGLTQPQQLTGFTNEWKKYSCTVETTATDPRARLNLTVRGAGTLDLDMISLFPQETFNNRPNGLRPDLVQLLKDLKPGFMRFPGGCIVEGRTLAQRYQWKTTIGDVSERKLIMNRWNVEFAAPRNAPDYYESMGLGFFEYFQLCEDIGAKPLPILNCGMACQFNMAELVPLDQLGPYIQDALDLIEFANGPTTSTWGAKRAAMGHPEPFGLTMLGIGNEQWGPQYIARYDAFAKVLKEKHPEIRLVSGTGPEPSDRGNDNRFSYAWTELKRLKSDIVDEHFYKPPTWFYQNVNRYDAYDRTGPKVFAGEYAAHIPNKRPGPESNIWEAALAEASVMTGFERNADLVEMTSYAPLFAHVDAWQWNPDLIWFDNLRSFGTVNYYVQKMFSTNRGTRVLPVSLDGAGEKIYACAAQGDKPGEVIIKVVNVDQSPRKVKLSLPGGAANLSGTMQVLSAPELTAMNSLDEPTKFAPATRPIEGITSDSQQEFPGYSLTVLRLTPKAE